MSKDLSTEIQTTGATVVHEISVQSMFETFISKVKDVGAEQAVAIMNGMVDLQMKLEAKEAKRRFHEDYIAMRAELPLLTKTKRVPTRDGGTKFSYTPLPEIVTVTTPILTKWGFVTRYDDVAPLRDVKNVRSRCWLMHKDGHSEYAEFEAPPDDANTKVNNQQKTAGASSFAGRHALIKVLGVTFVDEGGATASGEPITMDQANEIGRLLNESGARADLILRMVGVSEVVDIPQSNYNMVCNLLKEKIEQKKGVQS